MTSKNSQFLFNEIFKPYSKKEIKKIDKELGIKRGLKNHVREKG